MLKISRSYWDSLSENEKDYIQRAYKTNDIPHMKKTIKLVRRFWPNTACRIRNNGVVEIDGSFYAISHDAETYFKLNP